MPLLKNFVAVDWRSGPDRCYFFFKDNAAYTRFDFGDNKVPEGYPAAVSCNNWHDFHRHVKGLRFGFTTTGIRPTRAGMSGIDSDILWLFYIDDDMPMVCKYDQDTDKVHSVGCLEDSPWYLLRPYFNRIVAGTWWQNNRDAQLFRFLMSDGTYLSLDLLTNRLTAASITATTWPGLENYKHRIITAVQNDRTFADSYYYIFLTHNEYITYNIMEDRVEYGPYKVSEKTWPGLLRD
ncbi:MAG: hypothetical protein ABIO21_10315 [Pseudomonas sp.]